MLLGFLLYSLRGSKIEKTSKTRKDRILLLLKSMCLGSVSKMFLLPIVIWSSLQNEFVVKLNFLLVMGYYLCGLVHVHSGKHCSQRLFPFPLPTNDKFFQFVFQLYRDIIESIPPLLSFFH